MNRRMLIVLCMVVSTAAMAIEWRKHPHLERAAAQVQAAKGQLAAANDLKKTQFRGHRIKALELLELAEREISAAAAYAESDAK